MILLRPATTADVPAINEIVNYYIRETTANWSWTKRSMEDAQRWFADHRLPQHPVYVAEEDGELLGFGALSPFRTKEGYWPVAENSLYVRPEHQGRGIGRLLLERLIAEGRAAGLWAITAWITDDNAISIRLHEKYGFYRNGHMEHIGQKFDRPLSVLIMQLDLQEGREGNE